MEPAIRRHPSSSSMRAYFVSAVFFVASVLLFIGLLDAIKAQPFSQGVAIISASPWGLAAVFDYAVGAAFGVMFIWLRETPPMLFISHKVIAVIFPFLGNFLLLLYMSYVIFIYKSVDVTFVPKSLSPRSEPLYDPPANMRQSKLIGFVFATLLVLLFGICFWAFRVQSVSDGLIDFRTNRWVALSFHDNLAGILLTFAYVVVREEGVPSVVIPWFLGFALLGNFATCFYVIKLSYESLRRDVSFKFLFLSRSKVH